VVGYDSIIPPGREGKVTQTVNLENYHGGAFRKSAMVESDASNTPSVALVIKGLIKAVIEITPTSIKFNNGDPIDKNPPLSVKTTKPDLKIEEVTFKPAESGNPATGGAAVWQSDMPLYATFDFKRVSPKPDSLGDWEYQLRLAMTTKDTKMQWGEFTVTTNHPDKPQVNVHGEIDIKK
jgi:hypothetical protein